MPSRVTRLALLLAVVASACGGPPGGGATSAGPETAGGVEPEAVERWGLGPQPDPSVTYQPDVILIEGGPAAVRGASADGLTFSLDAAAGGVADLAPGRILFASSRVLGRVVRTEARGDIVDVTLAPVGLGEVIRDGHLTVDQAVSVTDLGLYEAPQVVDGFEDVPADELTSAVPGGVTLARVERPSVAVRAEPGSVRAGGVPGPGPAPAAETSTKVGDWTVTAYRTNDTAGLRAERGVGSKSVQGADLKVALDAHVEIPELRVVADIPVTRGEVGTSHFRVFGITGLAMSIQAGAVNGLSDNRKARVEIPLQLTQNLIIGGFPFTLTQKFKFLVQTAFTAKNGNLTASGAWDVDGSLGIDGQTVTVPTMTARGVRVIDSIASVSVGVNGIVAAVSFEFGLLAGMSYAGAGPRAALITSLGLTNGSSLGIVECRQASITATVSAGVGIAVFDPVRKALKQLGYDVPEQTTLASKDILQEQWVKPDVAACR